MWLLLPKINFLAVVSNCDPNKDNTGYSFLGFPHWWEYISTGQKDLFGKCTPVVTLPQGAWAIAFAVVDMLLYLAGLVAVISIIIAGIQYITATGSADKNTAARKRIQNSLIGLAIVLIASSVVSFIGNKIG